MRLIFTLVLFCSAIFLKGQTTCITALPFCPNPGYYNYSAGQNNGTAPIGPSYGCLGSQPNPAWFYLETVSAGSIAIQMAANQDIDFICWGPFPNLNNVCNNLNASMIVPNNGGNNGCSFSGSASETLAISNVQSGEFYMLMVTNFSNSNQQISLTNISGSSALLSCSSISLSISPQPCTGSAINLSLTTANISNLTTTIVPGVTTFTGSTFTYTPQTSITHSLYTSGLNTIGNTYTTLNTFIVNPTPTISLGANTSSICLGDSLVIYYGGAPNIIWTGGIINGGFGVTVSPTVSTTYTFVGINSFSCQSNVANFNVSVLPCTNSLFNQNGNVPYLDCYPNPANDYILLNCTVNINSISIFNCAAELIKTAVNKTNHNSLIIETSMLTPGVYFLKVCLENGQKSTIKFVKN